MKKVYVFQICALLLIFLTAGVIIKPQSDSKIMESQIQSRIEILNKYYDGTWDYDRAETALEKVEKGSLLKTDTALMKDYELTDMEQVTEYTVTVISSRTTRYNMVKCTVKIDYTMYGQQGKRKESHKYLFTGEKEKKRIRLSGMQII